jgi:hypothetical protein
MSFCMYMRGDMDLGVAAGPAVVCAGFSLIPDRNASYLRVWVRDLNVKLVLPAGEAGSRAAG